MKTGNPLRDRNIGSTLMDNSVTIIFVVLCVLAFISSGQTFTFLLPELFDRFSRNTFLIVSLIIPVVAGMGLNFGIVTGAIAAQISLFCVVYWGFTGLSGFLLCALIATPIAVFFGWLIGKLFNSMKGSEMIGGMVLGYFSDGLYQLLFLFVVGGIIPMRSNTNLMIPVTEAGAKPVGVINTIDLTGNLKYALDKVPLLSIIEVGFYVFVAVTIIQWVYRMIKKEEIKLLKTILSLVVAAAVYALTFVPAVERFLNTDRLQLLDAILLLVVVTVVFNLYQIVRAKIQKKDPRLVRRILYMAAAVVVYALTYIPNLEAGMLRVQLPVLTYLCIAGACMFVPWLMSTKLGQDMRTVGQNRAVAASAGINVDRVRIIAMVFSTVMASYGQLISLQNLGTFSTYGAHNQVGQYAIAALLVGGASVRKATVNQALLGVFLFHTLFILAPDAGAALFGDAQIGEYFRAFVVYGVIALALALHAMRSIKGKRAAAAA